MQRVAAALFALATGAGVAASVRAQNLDSLAPDQPLEIAADSLEYEGARDLYVGRGAVRLRQGDRTVSADWIGFNHATGHAVAAGHVVYTDGEDTVRSNLVQFNVNTVQGLLLDAHFDAEAHQLRMEGAEVQKTGEATYAFKRGTFTTCECPEGEREPWRIRASEADLEVGGYGTARNATIEVLDVPVIWVPWLLYPVKTERQTGFLFPDFGGGSRSGLSVGLPFFWAVADNVNATLTPRWLQDRGPKGDGEIEYVLGEESQGEVFGSFLRDDDIEPNSDKHPFDRERWSVLGEQDLFLPAQWRFKADFAFLSDNQYPTDFNELRQERHDRFLQSAALGGRALGASGRYGLEGSAAYADDLQNPDNLDRDLFLLQRLPRADFALLPAPLTRDAPIVPTLGVQFTNFWPRESATDVVPLAPAVPGGAVVVGDKVFLDTGIDGLPNAQEPNPEGISDPHGDDFDKDTNPKGTEGNGFFDEGEPLADRGQRLLLTPRLGLPWRVADALEVYPEVGWHQLLYESRAQGLSERGLFTGRLDLRSRLRRRLGAGLTHLLEPRLGYALLTQVSKSGNPLYVPPTAVPQRRVRELDLDNVVLDPADRTASANRVTLGLGNRFFRAREGGASRLFADFALSGEYDFEDRDFGWLLVDGRLYGWRRISTKFSFGFDPERGRVAEGLAELGWANEKGFAVVGAYRFLRDAPRFFEDYPDNQRFNKFEGEFDRVNQGSIALRIPLGERWRLLYNGAYSFEQSLLLRNGGGFDYLSRCRCWSVRFQLDQDRQGGLQFNFSVDLIGLGSGGGRRGAALGQMRRLGLLDDF